MIIVPVSFNGTSLQSSDFISHYPQSNDPLSPSVSPQYIKRAGVFPVLSGSDFNSVSIGLEIECLGAFMDTFETLVQIFNVEDETPRELIISDGATTDTYSVYAIPKAVVGGSDGAMARVTLALDDPIWKGTLQNSQTFATTSATDSTSVTVSGNADAYPVFEITPSSLPSSDYLYNVFLQVLPTSTIPYPNRFLDVVGTTDGTGLDTAALVALGHMQADGDDLRLFRDGLEVDRQLSGMNTTDTHIITNCDMPGSLVTTLRVALSAVGNITEVEVNLSTVALITTFSLFPPTGRLILDTSLGSTDTEEVTYTAKVKTGTKLAFTVGVNNRALRGTTAAAHAINTNVRFLPYDFNLVYGNPSATAPTIDDTRKPIQELTSRNNSFVYNVFRDTAGLRAGIWSPMPSIVTDYTRSNSTVYTSTNDLDNDVDPVTAMGVKALTYDYGGAAKADTVKLGWENYFPDLIASVSAITGEQSQYSAIFPALSLQSAITPTLFTNLFTVSAQAATDYGTWTTWTKASSDAVVGAGKKYLRWTQVGTESGTLSAYSKAAITAITVGLTNVPHCLIRAETSNFYLNFILRNDTTGDYFQVAFPGQLNDTLIIDTDPNFPNAKFKGQIVNGAVKVSSIRSAWMRFAPGANTLSYESQSGDAMDVSVAIKWYSRMRFL